MRRIAGALIIAVLLQLVTPAPAYAWWEFIEPWSGPGWWQGPDIDARLMCFVDSVSRPEKKVATSKTEAARDSTVKLRPKYLAWSPGNNQAFLQGVTDADIELQKVLNQWENVLNEWELLAIRSADKVSDIQRVMREVRQRPRTSALTAAQALVTESDAGVKAAAGTPARTTYERAQMAYQDAVAQVFALTEAHDRAAEAIASIALMGHAIAFAGPGFIFSACRLREYDRRRAAIDVGMRFAWANDDRYAGGERMMLTTIEPAFTWSIFDDPKYDFVDYGIGAGFFWVSSRAFPSVKGGFLEPARFDFHLPTSKLNHTTRSKILRSLVFRVGWLNFPGGFEQDAFLPDPNDPEVNRRIGRDLVRYYGIYIDTEVFHKRRPALPKP